MFKIIIVDDEILTLEQLSNILDWGSLDFEIAGQFSDGSEAIEFIKNNTIDAVLSDVKMANVSGLDIAKFCSECYPNIQVVLLSAYRDFEFARLAMKYNVLEYVTKPITYTNLYNAIKNIKSNIKKKDKNTFLNEELYFRRRQLIFDYLAGIFNDIDELNMRLKDTGYPRDITISPCSLIKMHIDDYNNYIPKVWRHEKDRLYDAISHLISSNISENDFSMLSYHNELIEIIAFGGEGTSPKEFEQSVKEFLKYFTNNLLKIMKINIKTDNLQIASNISKINKYKSSIILTNQQANTISSYIHKGDFQSAKLSFDTISYLFSDHEDMIRALCRQVQLYIKKSFNIEICFITDSDDIDKCRNKVNEAISNVQEMYTLKNHNLSDKTIQNAIKFMQENMSHNISLVDVAAHVALNPSYLSVYFKQQTGEKFIDYLTNLRIDEAKRLLNDTDAKIDLISFKIGYKDTSYFYKIFKLYTGFTPTKFRNNLNV